MGSMLSLPLSDGAPILQGHTYIFICKATLIWFHDLETREEPSPVKYVMAQSQFFSMWHTEPSPVTGKYTPKRHKPPNDDEQQAKNEEHKHPWTVEDTFHKCS